jgi:outer membrane biosynthesis protein TonB
MKRVGIGSTALMLLLFGATYSFAQDNPAQHEEGNKAPHQEQPTKQAQPAQHQEKAPVTSHTEKAPPAQHQEKAPIASHTEKAPPAQDAKRTEPAKTAKPAEHTARTEQAKPAPQHTQSATRTAPRTTENTRTTASTRTQNTETTQRAEQSHNFGGHGGGHIADARFQASFGSSHHFHINRPTIYEGYSRFNYGGYYFGFYDPWPSDWGYSDDVYVDYIDGQYYLLDPEHPGSRLMINVVL